MIACQIKYEQDSPDDGARQIAKVSGQLWLGQLQSLMSSINKWPISLSPKAIARSVCSKACALVHAESAALFLVNHAAQELILQDRFPARPPDQRPAGSTGAAATRIDVVRVKFGVGILGSAAAESKAAMLSDVAAEESYDPQFDNIANRPGLEAAPDTMLCVPLSDCSGNMIAMLQLTDKKGGNLPPGKSLPL